MTYVPCNEVSSDLHRRDISIKGSKWEMWI